MVSSGLELNKIAKQFYIVSYLAIQRPPISRCSAEVEYALDFGSNVGNGGSKPRRGVGILCPWVDKKKNIRIRID